MAGLADAGKKSMLVRGLAVDLTSGLMQKDFLGEARACLEFVRDRIRYVRDIEGVETLHDAETVLRQGAGDCDDKCILLAALLLSIGAPVRFVAVAFEPEVYSHVWLQVRTPPGYGGVAGSWVDLEPTEPIAFGAHVPLDGCVDVLTRNVP